VKKTLIRLATVFSGIGSVEFALKRLNIPYDIIFACDNGERDIVYDEAKEKNIIRSLSSPIKKKKHVDELYQKATSAKNYVKESYLANYHNFNENYYFQDIKLLDGTDFEGKVDLFVGGSPCQSFSSVGFQGGLEDARGTLFYEYARLIEEIKPKVFIYENVRNLLNHDHGKTWKVIQQIFDSLGYSYKYEILNSSDYGIPQTRRRLFVVGFRNDLNIDTEKAFSFPPKTNPTKFKMKDFSINNCAEGNMTFDDKGNIKLLPVKGIPNEKYILSPKLYDYVMKSGTKTWHQKVEINKDIARTLLKTMGNRHRAGVDNYLSFDETDNLGSVRMLTEREALRLMGYTDDYQIVVSRAQTYKQAGNSIVVDVMMAILKEIIDTGVFYYKRSRRE
jgi:DNA (cytosine-5-)-methyltransferase